MKFVEHHPTVESKPALKEHCGCTRSDVYEATKPLTCDIHAPARTPYVPAAHNWHPADVVRPSEVAYVPLGHKPHAFVVTLV